MGKPYDSDSPLAEQTDQAEELGKRLRKAREACHLSIPSAAASLHLPPRVIEALEANDFGQFEPVYVRGYLRNYARLLNLAVEPLLESYNRTLAPDQPSPQPPSPRKENTPQKLVYALCAVFVLPLLLWGASQMFRPSKEAGAVKTDAPVVPVQTPGATPDAIPLPRPTENLPKPQDIGPSEAKAEPAPPPAPKATAASLPAAEPASKPHEAVAAPPSPAPSQAGPGPDTVTLRLSASAWVAIRDQTGRRLVYATLPAGSDQTYSGQAPFSVVLGNTPAATLTFNGQPFDPPKSKAGTVARFSLGQPNQ